MVAPAYEIGNSIVPGTSGAVIRDEHLHVWRSCYGWKASGKEGDYGLAPHRTDAISCARDASATAHSGKRLIRVYNYYGVLDHEIMSVRDKPSSQAFQDNVP